MTEFPLNDQNSSRLEDAIKKAAFMLEELRFFEGSPATISFGNEFAPLQMELEELHRQLVGLADGHPVTWRRWGLPPLNPDDQLDLISGEIASYQENIVMWRRMTGRSLAKPDDQK